MKKTLSCALIILFTTLVSLLAVTGAMAASFDVTTESGVRVSEKGSCEQIGSSRMTTVAAGDQWGAGTVITIELLYGATVCEAVDTTALGLPYVVTAVPGDDFFTVTIGAAAYGGVIEYGAPDSRICLNLSNTPYNAQTNPLVQVTYRDTESNSYSGDFVVATVKPSAHEIDICTKIQRNDAFIPGAFDAKTGVPIIPLCVGSSQSQEEGGCELSGGVVCINISDTTNQFGSNTYAFTLATDKPGVGISTVQAFRDDPQILTQLNTFVVERRDSSGAVVTGEDCAALATTAEIDFEVDMIGTGGVILQVGVAYDTTAGASPGSLLMDVAFNRVPCGDSAGIENLKVADLVVCGDGGQPGASNLLFPYSPALDGWWAGFAITNLSNSEVSVTLECYEADGDRYDGSLTIGPYGIYAANAMDLPVTTSSADAAWGDERFWIKAFGSGAIDGLLFFGNNTEGMGYLPRTSGMY